MPLSTTIKLTHANLHDLKSTLVIIYSSETRYGRFLKNLVQHVYDWPELFINIPLAGDMVKQFRPALIILNFGNDFDDAILKTYNSLPNISFFIVANKPKDKISNCEKFTYFWKPLEIIRFIASVYEVLVKTHNKNAHYTAIRKPSEPFLIGNSQAIIDVRRDIQRVSTTDLNVLITGDTGTGKGVVAQLVHNKSNRRFNHFLEVNCANVPTYLLESELFGYKKGAFTGAWQDKPGKFQIVDRGTIFLDEISEMKPNMQAKLLQVLQDGEFNPLGGVENIQVNVRVIAATNAVLKKIMESGLFRRDLYYRLAVITLYLPPLRERPEDIPLLAYYFLEKYASIYRNRPKTLSKEFWKLLEEYDWPGNVRELENKVKSIAALDNEQYAIDDLKNKVKRIKWPQKERSLTSWNDHFNNSFSLKEITTKIAIEAEKEVIGQALNEAKGRKKFAAQLLGVSYKCLLNKIKAYGFR